MRVGIMVTNHGSHSASKWASESAAQITDVIVIEPGSIVFDTMIAAKAKLAIDLEAALSSHHDTVQSHEKAAIERHGYDRLEHPIAPESDHLDEAVASVLSVSDTSMFAAHFRKPEVMQFVRSTLGSHFASVRQIERSTHADKAPHEPKVKAFREKFHG